MKNGLLKKTITFAVTAGVMVSLCACGNQAVAPVDETPEEYVNEVVDEVADEIANEIVDEEIEDNTDDELQVAEKEPSTGMIDASGDEILNLANDDGSTITISPLENGEVDVEVSLTRIGVISNGNGAKLGEGFYVFKGYGDGEENYPMDCEILVGDNGYQLHIVTSAWDIIPEDEIFDGFYEE